MDTTKPIPTSGGTLGRNTPGQAIGRTLEQLPQRVAHAKLTRSGQVDYCEQTQRRRRHLRQLEAALAKIPEGRRVE